MAWQLRLASPSAAAGGAPTLPLPDPPLKEMCMLPVGTSALLLYCFCCVAESVGLEERSNRRSGRCACCRWVLVWVAAA